MQRMALGSSVRPCMRCCRAKRNLFQEKNHLDTPAPLLCPSWLWDGLYHGTRHLSTNLSSAQPLGCLGFKDKRNLSLLQPVRSQLCLRCRAGGTDQRGRWMGKLHSKTVFLRVRMRPHADTGSHFPSCVSPCLLLPSISFSWTGTHVTAVRNIPPGAT